MDDAFAAQAWSALANVDWYHPKTNAQYSTGFRSATEENEKMSKLAHSDDYHMALIDAQAMINAGFSRDEVKDALLWRDLSHAQMDKVFAEIERMKPQPQSAA